MTPIFRSSHNCQFHHRRLESLEHYNVHQDTLSPIIWNITFFDNVVNQISHQPCTKFISSATVIVRAEGAIWLNPFATVLFNVCSAGTVECCILYPCYVGVCCYVRKNALPQCLCNDWEEEYGPVWGAPVYVFVGFWDGDYVSELPYVWY